MATMTVVVLRHYPSVYRLHFFFIHLSLKNELFWSILYIVLIIFTGLPTIFQLFAQHIPPDERSRAFGYMVAAGSVGQTVASLVSGGFHYL